MKAKQAKHERKQLSAILIFSLIIFVPAFAWMFYIILNVDIPILQAIFTFLADSSGFLSFLCIVMFAMSLLRSQKQIRTAILDAFNIVLLNRLYLNSQYVLLYKSVKKFLSEVNWPNVLFFGVLVAIIAYCIYIGWKSRHEKAIRKRASIKINDIPQKTFDVASVSKHSVVQQNSGSEARPNQSNDLGTAPASLVLLRICLFVVIVYIVKVLFYDVWMVAAPPESLNAILNVLPILAVLCIGVIISFAIYKFISGIEKTFRNDNFRVTALLAMFLESGIILAVVLNHGNLPHDFLSNFMDNIVNNSLVALPLILVTMFIILDIFISIILKITLGRDSHDWITKTEQRIVLIEQGLTTFVCNLMIGGINLLLFIPDFFNHIGQLLLDEDSFFPQEKIYVKELTPQKEDIPPKGCSVDITDPSKIEDKETADEERKI